VPRQRDDAVSRTLKRVPLDFSWPEQKVWKGYVNPYAKLSKHCPDCAYGEHGPRGYSPRAYRFYQEWYGYVAFDPVAYGAKPITVDHPRIRAHATAQVNRSPEFYMTPEERRRERQNLQKAGIDLIELMKTTEELKAELDAPPGDLEDLQQPGLVRIGGHRGAAIEREVRRLYEQCIKGHWCHHLTQDDVDALVAASRLPEFTHRPVNQEQVEKLKAQGVAGGSGYWLDEPNGYCPTADEVNAWALFGMGHDAINQGVCLAARCAREGVQVECPTCVGKGSYWPDVEYDDLPRLVEGLLKPEQILAIKPVGKLVPSDVVGKLYEEWEDYEPPAGPGYQLWEKVSEGSPVSPVFGTFDDLCAWAEGHSVAGRLLSKEQWKSMLEADFVYTVHETRGGVTLISV